MEIIIQEKNRIPDWITLDFNIYHQVLFYLVQNAVKFSREETPVFLNVSFIPFQQGNVWENLSKTQESKKAVNNGKDKMMGYLVTKIIDFGKGIEKSRLPTLFKTFTRKGSKKGIFRQAGIGVGLSTAHSLS